MMMPSEAEMEGVAGILRLIIRDQMLLCTTSLLHLDVRWGNLGQPNAEGSRCPPH